jgi:hypothetical protein
MKQIIIILIIFCFLLTINSVKSLPEFKVSEDLPKVNAIELSEELEPISDDFELVIENLEYFYPNGLVRSDKNGLIAKIRFKISDGSIKGIISESTTGTAISIKSVNNDSQKSKRKSTVSSQPNYSKEVFASKPIDCQKQKLTENDFWIVFILIFGFLFFLLLSFEPLQQFH